METTKGESKIINVNAYNFVNGIIRLFKILLKKWYIIMIAGLLGGGLGYLYAYYDKPVYESYLSFSLEESSSSGDLMSLAAEFGLNFGSNKSAIFSGENILSIFKSRSIIEKVLLQTDSSKLPNSTIAQRLMEINRLDKKWEKHPRLSDVSFPLNVSKTDLNYLQDSVLFLLYRDVVLKNLFVDKPNKKFNLFEIRFKSYDEEFSKLFTERLIDQTTSFYFELKTKRSKKTLDILETRVGSMRGSAGSAIQSRASIADANLNPAFAQQGAQIQQRQLDATAFGSAYSELFKNLEIARYQYLQEMPLLQIIDGVNYPLKRIKKGKLLTAIAFSIGFGMISSIFILLRVGIKRYKSINSGLKGLN